MRSAWLIAGASVVEAVIFCLVVVWRAGRQIDRVLKGARNPLTREEIT
jgi:hypothetical protein